MTMEKCKVLFDFEAQTDQELTVKAGDTIELTTDYGDGWAECVHQGKSGLVPVTFFKRLQPTRIVPTSLLPPQKPYSQVTVQVFEAQNLEIKDLVSSDPYVVVQVGDSEKQKTKTVYKNLNPKWQNAIFTFPAPPKDKEFVKFSLYDKDFLSKDDPMGSAIVTLGALRFGGNPMWLDLTDCSKGKLHVNIILHA